MSYISLEINKQGKSVEILLGGTVLEESEMHGGIALKINNVDEDVLCCSEIISEKKSVIEKKQKERKKREESHYLSQGVVDALNKYRADNELTLSALEGQISAAAKKSATTIKNNLNLSCSTPQSAALAISEVIGCPLKAEKDEFGQVVWTLVKSMDAARVEKAVAESKELSDRGLLSKGIRELIDTYLTSSGKSVYPFYHELAAMTGISKTAVEDIITAKAPAPHVFIKKLEKVLMIPIALVKTEAGMIWEGV